MKEINIVSHPLIEHSLTIIRKKNTSTEEFRRHAGIVSKILLVEVMKGFETSHVRIKTPLASMTGKKLKDEVVVVPVLRAGLAMLFAIQDFLPAVLGLRGMKRPHRPENTIGSFQSFYHLIRYLLSTRCLQQAVHLTIP